MGIMDQGSFYVLASLTALNTWVWDDKNVEYYLKRKPEEVARHL